MVRTRRSLCYPFKNDYKRRLVSLVGAPIEKRLILLVSLAAGPGALTRISSVCEGGPREKGFLYTFRVLIAAGQ